MDTTPTITDAALAYWLEHAPAYGAWLQSARAEHDDDDRLSVKLAARRSSLKGQGSRVIAT